MKLYVHPASPYGRIVRIVMIEKGLEGRVEIVVPQLRVPNSPYYAINPSGRIPYLVRDDGTGLEESALICAWLDQLDGKPMFDPPAGDEGWEMRRLEAESRGMLDGFAVWARELGRPENERSPGVIAHEAGRGERLLNEWERKIGHPLLSGALNLAQVTLATALGFADRVPGLSWREGHPKLSEWYDRISTRPSLAATTPPPR